MAFGRRSRPSADEDGWQSKGDRWVSEFVETLYYFFLIRLSIILNNSHAKLIKSEKPDGVLFILIVLLYSISSIPVLANQQSQQIPRDEIKQELRQAYLNNNNLLAVSLIRNNRLLIIPFVDVFIKEILVKELKGKA